jgi:hypothetical protein
MAIACKTCIFGEYTPSSRTNYAGWACYYSIDEKDLENILLKAPVGSTFDSKPRIQRRHYRLSETPKQCRSWKEK